MKEALVSAGPRVHIVDTAVPEPADGQVLIKVIASGSNPKDWKIPEWTGCTANTGDDIAGVVAKVGSGVVEFKPGDRVAAFHNIEANHGSYAEYAIANQAAMFHIPESTSFEEASTIPLVALTAAVALYIDLGLPQPWLPATETTPFIIYGAATAVGAAAIQLAMASNIHPIFAVAGESMAFVETLIDKSKGDVAIDYRGGDEAAATALERAIGHMKVRHALDAISDGSSNYITSRGLQHGGKVALVLPWNDDKRIATESVMHVWTTVGRIHKDLVEFGFVFSRYLSYALHTGVFKPHPYKVIPGGLAGVEIALKNLRDGKAHGIKYVFQVPETTGAGCDML